MTAPARRGGLPAILDALPALCAPYIDPDASIGTVLVRRRRRRQPT
ncbi:MAG: hypothetical protein ACTIBZ_11850 [Corynebacterium variabile]